ncbi:MAG: hypothetical protein DWQ04_27105 [Chloroflexi bacterium]|nr:MAG: hypothetical protein DWQ04_27105 [Chloroflexota bacterium]
MKTNKTVLVFIILIIILGSVVRSSNGLQQQPTTQLDLPDAAPILQASVQITMFKIESVGVTTTNDEKEEIVAKNTSVKAKSAYGIGTLVSFNEEVLLLTHDHWPYDNGIEMPDWVLIQDANGLLLTEISGDAFYQNILFRDSGTLVMQAPEELLSFGIVPAEMRYLNNQAVGDTVTIVRHQPGTSEKLDLLDARIQSISLFSGVPQVELQSLNSESLERGDSGGGIWADGQLVGNTWMRIRQKLNRTNANNASDYSDTDLSIGAAMTTDLFDLLNELQSMKELPPIVDSPIS